MDFKYRWKNGAPPSRDEAARSESLLDEDQFNHPKDREMAEEEARRYLNVPIQTADAGQSILPKADSTEPSV